MWLTALLNYKKNIAVISVVISVIAGYNLVIKNAFDKGFQEATITIQKKHNALMQEQIKSHTLALNNELEIYNTLLKENKAKRDFYWQSKLDENSSRLRLNHKIELEAQRIKSDAKYITGSVSDDALELFKYARRIVSKPAD